MKHGGGSVMDAIIRTGLFICIENARMFLGKAASCSHAITPDVLVVDASTNLFMALAWNVSE